ncbi:VanW family protein [Candidatus Curtissbacteria bacterium]|nr:VanW family protein [Candidatus Curtissbacteria bacterium]
MVNYFFQQVKFQNFVLYSRFFLKNFIAALLLFTFVFSLFATVYSGKIYPNIYFTDVNLSGLRRSEVNDRVAARIRNFESSKLTFILGERKIEASAYDLGIEFDEMATANKILNYGKSVNLSRRMLVAVKSLFVNENFLPVYSVNFEKLSENLDRLISPYETRSRNASVVFVAGQPKIEREVSGMVVDRIKLVANLFEAIDSLSNDWLKADIVSEVPLVNSLGAQKAYEKAALLQKQQLALSFNSDKWSLGGQDLVSMLNFYPEGYEADYLAKIDLDRSPVIINFIKPKEFSDSRLEVVLNREKFDQFADTISESINRPTIDATLRFQGGKVVEFTPASDGQKLDIFALYKIISEQISSDSSGGDQYININLPVTISTARVLDEKINTLGIRSLVGRGISYFAGSIANRVSNIGLAASRINGTLVAPGETFSFNQIIGDVSAATGYKKAYVISQGRTVLDDGGGVCQVSTTLFRAALNSGLPIVARTAHAYRVGYYEQRGFKPGLDATVWSPAVDFQFRNDTEHYILVQAMVDLTAARLEVDFYGTVDGRRSEISDPVISNIQPPPPDKYQDDPTLPKGTVKQVDFAAPGATSVFKRKVFKDQQLIIDESFTSNFRPWQAIYLVGTGS